MNTFLTLIVLCAAAVGVVSGVVVAAAIAREFFHRNGGHA
jgi:hypothetical protein